MMNEDSEPMNFSEVRRLAKGLGVKGFQVTDVDKYAKKAKNHTEPKNCVVYIASIDNPNFGHYAGIFTESDGSLNYQDSFGKMNDVPDCLKSCGRLMTINKVKYQGIKANNCGYLSMLHVATHDEIDPTVLVK